MNNQPAERTQVDGLQDLYSRNAAIDTSGLPDMARQEFKDEVDVNHILQRFGVGGLNPRAIPRYEEVDFDQDLQGAYDAIEQAKSAWQKMPQHVKDTYPDWRALLTGAEAGEQITLTPPPEPPIVTPPTTP